MQPDMQIEAIKWIEEFRRERSFHKGYFYYDDWEHGLILYQRWWETNLPWSEKKLINPLEGTGATISWGA